MKNKSNQHPSKTFVKNLPEIIKSPLNSLHLKTDQSFDDFEKFNLKTTSHKKFIPYINERDSVGRLLSLENSSLHRSTSFFNHKTKLNDNVSSKKININSNVGVKKFHMNDKFKQTLDQLLNYNEEILKKKSVSVKKSPCFLSPDREQLSKIQENAIPALGIFYLSHVNIIDDKKNTTISCFNKSKEKIKTKSELSEHEILNIPIKKKILLIPDFNKQMGRINENLNKKRKLWAEDSKMIDKQIEFHKFITKRYPYKTKITPFFSVKLQNQPISFDKLIAKRIKIYDSYHIKHNKGRMKYCI